MFVANAESLMNKMQSDLKQEHMAAADEYINLKYPILLLFDKIRNYPNPNLVNMFFYISSKQDNADNAWAYLQQRVESEYFKYDSNGTFYPSELSSTERYLFFAARKWLLTKEHISVFVKHMIDINNNLVCLRKQIYTSTNNELSGVENSPFAEKEEVYSKIRKMRNLVMNSKRNYYDNHILSDKIILSKEEIDIASKSSSYSASISGINNSILYLNTYQQWLKNFFLETIAKQIPENNWLKSIFSIEVLANMIGHDSNYVERFQKLHISRLYEKEFTAVTVNSKIFEEVQSIIEKFDQEKYLEEAEEHSQCGKEIYRKKEGSTTYVGFSERYTRNSKPYFPDYPSPYDEKIYELKKLVGVSDGIRTNEIYNIFLICDDKDFKLLILNKYRDFVLKRTENRKFLLFQLMHYLYFEQVIFECSDSYAFLNICSFDYKFDLKFLEDSLFKYVQIDNFLVENSSCCKKATIALNTLLTNKSEKAFAFYSEMVSSKKMLSQMPYFESAHISGLRHYCQCLGAEKYFRDKNFQMGFKWESLCHEVVQQNNNSALINLSKVTHLSNGKIPDIVIGEIKIDENNNISHCKRIIECKKSIYYGILDKSEDGTIIYDLVNNKTTDKYIDFCDYLEYWILEKPENYKSQVNNKVKILFAEDILEWDVSEKIKNKIKDMLSQSIEKTSFKDLDARQLMNLSSFLIKNPNFYDERITQSAKIILPYVVKKYDASGQYICQYANTKKASTDNNITIDAIGNAIRGSRATAGGFIWRKCEADSQNENVELIPIVSLKDKVIFQISLDGEVINQFNAIAEAARTAGIDRKGIRDVINGRQKTAGGFYWTVHHIS